MVVSGCDECGLIGNYDGLREVRAGKGARVGLTVGSTRVFSVGDQVGCVGWSVCVLCACVCV